MNLNETMREALAAIATKDDDNATLLLGDRIRECIPEMPWDDADTLAHLMLGVEKVVAQKLREGLALTSAARPDKV